DIVGDADQRTAHHEPPREIRQVRQYGGRHLRCEADDETDDLVEVAQHLAALQQADRLSYVLGTYGSPVSRQCLRGRGGHGTALPRLSAVNSASGGLPVVSRSVSSARIVASLMRPSRAAAPRAIVSTKPSPALPPRARRKAAMPPAPRASGSRFPRSLPPAAEAD